MEVLQELFARHFHSPPTRVQPVQGGLGGSARKVIRLADDGHSAIGILNQDRAENLAFLTFTRHFRRHRLPVPEIYEADLERGAYLEEDLGDITLFDLLSRHRNGPEIAPEVIAAYGKVVDLLPCFQVEAGRDLDYSLCYPRASFDRQSIAWDLNYFKYYFLKLAGIPFSEQALEEDFGRLTRFLLSAPREYFLYRDFQSRNVMLRDGPGDPRLQPGAGLQPEPYFLDYQGGRKGALQYDIASLLYDAKADLPPDVRQRLLDRYLDALAGHITLDREAFLRHYYAFVYIRIMQALGTYGFRGFYERKPHFLQSVPYALKNLRWLAHNVSLPIALPTLMKAFEAMFRSERLQELEGAKGVVTVRIFSFSFHRGLPPDETGNGGGFVFDTRSIPNPGREERFKPLTGRDPAVIEYLEQQESLRLFFSNVTALVDATVSDYQRRGFQNLMVSFGCTGGQHRSVYLAERLAAHLRSREGVEVIVRHRELEKLGQ